MQKLKYHRFIKFVTIIFIVYLCIYMRSDLVYAEEINYKFKNMTIENGLSQSTVESILQDKDGYMWFGTTDGLNCYDGHTFRVYKYKMNEKQSLEGNYVNSLAKDKMGNLWIGTTKGLNKLELGTKNIKRYTNKTNCISHYNVWSIIVDSKGYIWIGTEKGLNKYDEKTNKFTHYYFESNNKNSLSDNFITSLFEGSDGSIWIGTKNGLNSLNPLNNKITRHMQNELSTYITTVYEDYKKDILIGTKLQGLIKYNPISKKIKRYVSTGKTNDLQSNYVKKIYQDNLKNIWIGTEQGLSKYNEEKDKFYTYKQKCYDNQSLVNNNVLNIYQDKSGLIWVGTYNGISRFNPNPKFKYYAQAPIKSDIMPDNMINGVCVDENNTIWVGTNTGGLSAIDRSTGKIISYKNSTQNENSISNNRIWGMIQDADGELWIATSYGLNKFNKKIKKFTRFFHKNKQNSIISNEVRCVYQDKQGLIWIGTRQGLDCYDKKTNTFKNYNDLIDKYKINDYQISYIYEDTKGYLWIGCKVDGGLIKFDKKNNVMYSFKHNEKKENSISCNGVECINEDSKGNIWIATHYGLNKFDTKSNKFTIYTENQGLSNNHIYGILIDNNQNLWISSNRGISNLNINTNMIKNYNVTDGLQSNEFNVYSYFKNKHGEMFFGGVNGLNSFYPDELDKNYYKCNVKLENLKVNDKEISIKKDIVLDYKKNNFYLEFFLPDFSNPEKNQYSYILEGLDKSWTCCKGRNNVNYTNIRSGNYTFKVKARNNNSIWTNCATVNITVKTPPWKSLEAYIIYTIIIICLISFLWNYVRILENAVQQRTSELNNKLMENEELYKKIIENEKFKNEYFINLSHELRAPFNSILSAIQLMELCLNEKDNKNLGEDTLRKCIRTIKNGSQSLLKVVNNLIDNAKIEAGSYSINLKEIDIINLVEETALNMKQFVEGNGINLIIDPKVEEKIIKCDPDEIARCIINLISNAVKFTPEGGSIYIEIYDIINRVKISVKDTGIGIPKEHQEKIFKRFEQVKDKKARQVQGSGIGLALVKSLVELHNGSITVISEGKNMGSEFIIQLPENPENITN